MNRKERVSGLLNSEHQLELVLRALEERGYGKEEISVAMSEATRDFYAKLKGETRTPEGAMIGGMSGGVLGAAAGALSMLGSVFAGPGVLIAGPLLGAIAGGALGLYGGAFLGALIGSGMSEHEARFYADALQKEGTSLVFVAVDRPEAAADVRALLRENGALQVGVEG